LVRATIGIQASDRHLSLVAPRGRRAAHVAVVMSVALGVAMLGAAAFQTQLAQRQVQLDQLDTDIGNAREQYESLRRERSELRSPERLAGIAAANGMVPANRSEFLDITPDVLAIVAASTGDIDPSLLGDAGNTLDDFREVKATTAAAGVAAGVTP
jgi:cell division protein FtsL